MAALGDIGKPTPVLPRYNMETVPMDDTASPPRLLVVMHTLTQQFHSRVRKS